MFLLGIFVLIAAMSTAYGGIFCNNDFLIIRCSLVIIGVTQCIQFRSAHYLLINLSNFIFSKIKKKSLGDMPNCFNFFILEQ
jgi:hypothetical protein